MDSRLNGDNAHGIPVFELASAGASFPKPSQSLSEEAASLVLLLNRARGLGKGIIMAFSGHYDCVMVNEIWQASAKTPEEQLPHEKTFLEPYRELITTIRAIQGLNGHEKIRLLNVAKTLQDLNYALEHGEVRDAMWRGHLHVVAYLEDPTGKDPATGQNKLYIFDPLRRHFVESRVRLAELSESETLLTAHQLRHTVDIRAFVALEAERMLHEHYRISAQAMVTGAEDAKRAALST